jgi:hypothetical protein
MRRSGIIALQAALVGCTVIELTVAANAGDTPSNPYIPLFSSIISPVLSGLLGFAGSLIGANFALTNFKRQRAFDKQLDWYERAAKAVYSLAEAIEIACTFQAQPNTSVEVRKKSWTYVQRAHLQIGRIAQESRFFGSTEPLPGWMRSTALCKKWRTNPRLSTLRRSRGQGGMRLSRTSLVSQRGSTRHVRL